MKTITILATTLLALSTVTLASAASGHNSGAPHSHVEVTKAQTAKKAMPEEMKAEMKAAEKGSHSEKSKSTMNDHMKNRHSH